MIPTLTALKSNNNENYLGRDRKTDPCYSIQPQVQHRFLTVDLVGRRIHYKIVHDHFRCETLLLPAAREQHLINRLRHFRFTTAAYIYPASLETERRKGACNIDPFGRVVGVQNCACMLSFVHLVVAANEVGQQVNSHRVFSRLVSGRPRLANKSA